MRDTFRHDDAFMVFNGGERVGDIDFRLYYRVAYWGRPEQAPSYASGGEPAEGPEIEVVSVTMRLNGEQEYIPAFDWLSEWVEKWAYETIDELVCDAREELAGQREATAER